MDIFLLIGTFPKVEIQIQGPWFETLFPPGLCFYIKKNVKKKKKKIMVPSSDYKNVSSDLSNM